MTIARHAFGCRACGAPFTPPQEAAEEGHTRESLTSRRAIGFMQRVL